MLSLDIRPLINIKQPRRKSLVESRDARAAMDVEESGQTRFCEAFSGNVGEREWKPARHTILGTLPEPNGRHLVSARAGSKLEIERRKIVFTSSRASVCGRGDRPIRKKIIGHGMSILPCRFTRRSVFLNLLRTLPLFHQPARQHGGGVFLHPKVEKRADLLAEIGGMAETREFITLQRVARSGEKKLPRRLGFVVIHGASRRVRFVN